MDQREWIARYIERMVELYRLSPELGHSTSEARRFAYESAQGAWLTMIGRRPEEVADEEFVEGRGNLHFLEAY